MIVVLSASTTSIIPNFSSVSKKTMLPKLCYYASSHTITYEVFTLSQITSLLKHQDFPWMTYSLTDTSRSTRTLIFLLFSVLFSAFQFLNTSDVTEMSTIIASYSYCHVSGAWCYSGLCHSCVVRFCALYRLFIYVSVSILNERHSHIVSSFFVSFSCFERDSDANLLAKCSTKKIPV